MSLRKKLKLSIALAIEATEDTLISNNSSLISLISAVTTAINDQSINTVAAVSFHRDDHIRMPGFCEEWINKYIDHDFYNLFRMTKKTFSELLKAVEEIVESHFTKEYWLRGREAVSLEKSLLIMLWYLGKGETFISISERFNVTLSTVYDLLTNCFQYMTQLMDKTIRWPYKVREQEQISEEFEAISGYPGVIGAIDGCHIPIKAPVKQHDSYQNRKFFHSINLQAICTASKVLTNIFVGFPGAAHDARVFKNSTLYKKINEHGSKTFFTEEKYHIVGDSAYILLNWLMKPYEESKRISRKEKTHNFKLSQTRVVIEHTFGFLKGRWRILKYINVNSIERAIRIVTVCCILHNFCLVHNDSFDMEAEDNNDGLLLEGDQYYEEDQILAKRKRDGIRDRIC